MADLINLSTLVSGEINDEGRTLSALLTSLCERVSQMDSAFSVIQMVSDKLMEFKDQLLDGQVVPLDNDFITVIKDFFSDGGTGTFTVPTGDLIEVTFFTSGSSNHFYVETNDSSYEIFRIIENGSDVYLTAGQHLSEALYNGDVFLFPNFQGTFTKATEFIKNLADSSTVSSVLKDSVESISDLISNYSLSDITTENVMQAIKGKISTTIPLLRDDAMTTYSNLVTAAQAGGIAGVLNIIKDMYNSINSDTMIIDDEDGTFQFKPLTPAVVPSFITGVLNSAVSGVSTIFNVVGKVVSTVTNAITAVCNRIFDAIRQKIDNATYAQSTGDSYAEPVFPTYLFKFVIPNTAASILTAFENDHPNLWFSLYDFGAISFDLASARIYMIMNDDNSIAVCACPLLQSADNNFSELLCAGGVTKSIDTDYTYYAFDTGTTTAETMTRFLFAPKVVQPVCDSTFDLFARRTVVSDLLFLMHLCGPYVSTSVSLSGLFGQFVNDAAGSIDYYLKKLIDNMYVQSANTAPLYDLSWSQIVNLDTESNDFTDLVNHIDYDSTIYGENTNLFLRILNAYEYLSDPEWYSNSGDVYASFSVATYNRHMLTRFRYLIPQYDRAQSMTDLIALVAVAVVVIAGLAFAGMAFKRMLVNKRIQVAAQVEQAWTAATEQPTLANAAAYRKQAFKANLWHSAIGGTKFNTSNYWDPTSGSGVDVNSLIGLLPQQDSLEKLITGN